MDKKAYYTRLQDITRDLSTVVNIKLIKSKLQRSLVYHMHVDNVKSFIVPISGKLGVSNETYIFIFILFSMNRLVV